MIVKDVMTDSPITVNADTPVGDVAQMFIDNDIRHLPVMEGDTMVGIISDRDLRSIVMPRLVDQAAIDALRVQHDEPISSIMASDPVTVYPDTELAEVVDLMLEHRVGALPVVDAGSGDLAGIISYVDVLRALADVLKD